jgi:hypothetical protein
MRERTGRNLESRRPKPDIAATAPRQARGRLRNFPRNRPETTNLNHQNASRRVFIGHTRAA